MYAVSVQESPVINVKAGRHEAVYAVDGSSMNPLEAFYAALAGCAAVFAKKACKELGVSPAGIDIQCKPFAGPRGPLTLAKFRTEVRFPAHFTTEQKAKVLDAIGHCAVKDIVATGADVAFSVVEA